VGTDVGDNALEGIPTSTTSLGAGECVAACGGAGVTCATSTSANALDFQEIRPSGCDVAHGTVQDLCRRAKCNRPTPGAVTFQELLRVTGVPRKFARLDRGGGADVYVVDPAVKHPLNCLEVRKNISNILGLTRY